ARLRPTGWLAPMMTPCTGTTAILSRVSWLSRVTSCSRLPACRLAPPASENTTLRRLNPIIPNSRSPKMMAAAFHPDPFFSLRGPDAAAGGAEETGPGVMSGGGIGGGGEEVEEGELGWEKSLSIHPHVNERRRGRQGLNWRNRASQVAP